MVKLDMVCFLMLNRFSYFVLFHLIMLEDELRRVCVTVDIM